MARGTWSLPESKLHINYLELKTLKESQDLCPDKTVLIATANNIMVAYINKEGGPGPVCLSTSGHSGQSGGEAKRLPLQENHSDGSRVAQHALVQGSNDHVQPDPSVPAQPADSTIQLNSTQESVKLKSSCLAPIALAIKEQGFCEAVAA